MRHSATDYFAGAGSGIAAAIAKSTTSRSTVPFPAPLANAPVLPLPGMEGDGTDWQDCPGEGSLNSVNSAFALPSRLDGPPD